MLASSAASKVLVTTVARSAASSMAAAANMSANPLSADRATRSARNVTAVSDIESSHSLASVSSNVST